MPDDPSCPVGGSLAQDASTSPKKRTTRIPFLGRTRKKSTHSIASSGVSSASGLDENTPDTADPAETAPVSNQNTRLTRPKTSPAESPVYSATVSPFGLPPPSLSSKLAAHFTPSKPRRPTTATPKPIQTPSDSADSRRTSDSLSPPAPNVRSASFDSGSSGTSANRSPTPRPAQPAPTKPTITVSLSPDNLDDYANLFTLPRKKLQPAAQNPPDGPGVNQPRDDESIRTADSHGGGTPPSPFPSESPIVENSSDAGSSNPDALEESERHRKKLTSNPTMPQAVIGSGSLTSQKRVTVATMPYHATENVASALPRQRFKSSIGSLSRPSRPPSIPLPPPPTGMPPKPSISTPTPQSPSEPRTPTNTSPTRPRANTTGSAPSAIPGTPGTPSKIPQSPSQKNTRTAGNPISPISGRPRKDDFNINTASPEQLKAALTTRNQQYDELASYLLKITESHVAEKHALEKKILSLEREAIRRDKEIKGLTWLVTNTRGASSASLTGLGSRSTSTIQSDQDTQRSQSRGSSRISLRRVQYTDDSGAESYQTSGAESMLGSGASGTESMSSIRDKKLRRPSTLETGIVLSQHSSLKRVPSNKSNLGPDFPLPPDLPYGKRSSVSSYSTSPASSTSSLLPPSPNPSTAMSSLSAIPEAHPNDLASGAADRQEKEERRASRASNRISASSLASSSSASSAYAANLKRGRPPSIAQVLQQSPLGETAESPRPGPQVPPK
ncbi:hypothetical protein BD779DRAFT_1669991 [Infundibulicybe gibba]|nr:hypothetical protein BD779DRAFT_1669991 [Infundibulicybe gibba]